MNTTFGRKGGRASIRLLAVVAALAPWAWSGRAEAQYGYGFGYGFGYGGFYNQNAYTDVNYLNQRSLINAQAAASNSPQPLTAPQFQSRDDNFYDKYDLATREAMINQVARHPQNEMGTASPTGVVPRSSTPRANPAAPPQPVPSSVHLANYFNKDQQLIWPSNAPITGEFGKLQIVADQAALAVLNEYQTKGLASLSNVTDARKKLLDYGRPALKDVREHSTPALADSFHTFLLSLYGNLGLAATVPKAP